MQPGSAPTRSSGTTHSVVSLRAAYEQGATSPDTVVEELIARLAAGDPAHVWIATATAGDLTARAADLASIPPEERGPLWGIPFAVKDNIDVAGMDTTAGLPAMGYRATADATAVALLLQAGAIFVGKTNLDQLATGLSGCRSAYGWCESVYGEDLIAGGSSSGSALVVAAGIVPFSLGTDTAGSGRVPAAMNGIVGLKPSRGLVSTVGVVPACRSLDCVSIFTHTVADALVVLSIIAGTDREDPWSRAFAAGWRPKQESCTLGVPDLDVLDFSGDGAMERAFADTVDCWSAGVDRAVAVDAGPVIAAGDVLYGPWLAERLAGLDDVMRKHGDDLLPVTRRILEGGRQWDGTDVFAAIHHLQTLRHQTDAMWETVDALLLPTVPTTFTRAEMAEEPLARNQVLGRFTQGINLLDLAAIAVPAGMTVDGRPVGVTLIGPAGSDEMLAAIAARCLGAPAGDAVGRQQAAAVTLVAVVGHHLAGQPRNRRLRDLGATLVGPATTAPNYQLWRIGTGGTPTPGLLRAGPNGRAIDVELWQLPVPAVGQLAEDIESPLSLGRVELADGRRVIGFLCEADATSANALDISSFGGWRGYLAAAAHVGEPQP